MKAGKNGKELRMVLFAVPPVMELDIFGPMSVFAAVNRLCGRNGGGYKIELTTTDPGCVITGPLGLSISAHRYYREIRGQVDTLLVVGGAGALRMREPAVLSWLCRMAAKVRRLGSVCTGAFLLAEAGLLNGKQATTHWALTRELSSRYPEVMVDPNPIWVRAGNVYTSAGVTAGMDLALGFVEDDYGSEMALKVARDLVLFLRRPGGQSQFSAFLSAQASERKALLELQIWMSENLSGNLSVETPGTSHRHEPAQFRSCFRP
jgi:transcriptional regulator GlxA family with amidase domain